MKNKKQRRFSKLLNQFSYNYVGETKKYYGWDEYWSKRLTAKHAAYVYTALVRAGFCRPAFCNHPKFNSKRKYRLFINNRFDKDILSITVHRECKTIIDEIKNSRAYDDYYEDYDDDYEEDEEEI